MNNIILLSTYWNLIEEESKSIIKNYLRNRVRWQLVIDFKTNPKKQMQYLEPVPGKWNERLAKWLFEHQRYYVDIIWNSKQGKSILKMNHYEETHKIQEDN